MVLKVLCLHGKNQNAEMFSKKLGALRKLMKSMVEFHFVNAPYDDNIIDDEKTYTWFSMEKKAKDFDINDLTGLDLSMHVIQEYINECGPFDGVLGFSQGGVLAAMIAKKQNVRFAIFCGTLIPQREDWKTDILAGSFDSDQWVPSLNIFGSADQVISATDSWEMAKCFGASKKITDANEVASILSEGRSVAYEHNGGHLVPLNSESRQIIAQFLKHMRHQ